MGRDAGQRAAGLLCRRPMSRRGSRGDCKTLSHKFLSSAMRQTIHRFQNAAEELISGPEQFRLVRGARVWTGRTAYLCDVAFCSVQPNTHFPALSCFLHDAGGRRVAIRWFSRFAERISLETGRPVDLYHWRKHGELQLNAFGNPERSLCFGDRDVSV